MDSKKNEPLSGKELRNAEVRCRYKAQRLGGYMVKRRGAEPGTGLYCYIDDLDNEVLEFDQIEDMEQELDTIIDIFKSAGMKLYPLFKWHGKEATNGQE